MLCTFDYNTKKYGTEQEEKILEGPGGGGGGGLPNPVGLQDFP